MSWWGKPFELHNTLTFLPENENKNLETGNKQN